MTAEVVALRPVRVSLYAVLVPGRGAHEPHSITLCECCYERVLSYYEKIGWTTCRVRDLTEQESYRHACLD